MTRARGFHVSEEHKLEDIEIEVHRRYTALGVNGFGERFVRCRCGWRSGGWSTPELAANEWRTHRDSQPRTTSTERMRKARRWAS